ncbi:helix-turn-helix domain-containing protein, partial [Streptomyces sp. 7R007]
MAEPDLSFVVRLRELYQHSGWMSLQSFADAVGYSRGTLSRFLSGERRPAADFLGKMFAALEDQTGHPVTEEAQAGTRRLYFECIRATRPHEYQVFELEENLKASYWEHQAAERLIHDLNQDLRETRIQRDQIDRERRALEQAVARDAAEHSQLQQRLTDEQTAYDTARSTLTEQIAELVDALSQAEQGREEARQTCEELREQLRTAQIRAEDERQQLIDDQEQQLRAERERRESLEQTLAEVL